MCHGAPDVRFGRGGAPTGWEDRPLERSLAAAREPFRSSETEAEWRLRAQVRRDPRTVTGGSDAGAHLDMMGGAMYSTALLAHGVREFGVVPMEEAVRYLTDVPARPYGLRDRGSIAEGTKVDRVLVNGVPLVVGGAFTGSTPGTLLRAGRDTETVAP